MCSTASLAENSIERLDPAGDEMYLCQARAARFGRAAPANLKKEES